MALSDGLRITRRQILQGSAAAAAGLSLPSASQAQELAAGAHRLWYRKPAREWVEALPVGNGRIGAMVFGGISNEKLQLNEDTLWTGGPYEAVNPAARAALPEVRRLVFAGRYAEAQKLADATLMAKPLSQMSYQSFGELLIDMPEIPDFWAREYRRELNLDSATATTVFTVGGATFRREVIACPVHQVIAVRISADKPGRIDCGITLRAAQPGSLAVERDTLIVTGTNRDEHGVAAALRFAGRVQVLHEGGTLEPRAGGIGVRDADSVTILVAMATNYRRYDDLRGDPLAITGAQIEAAAKLGFAGIAAAANAEHRRLYRAVALDLGTSPAAEQPTDARIAAVGTAEDPALATLYFNYGRYLLIGSSRPGSQPANLQGLWNDSGQPPWGSKYTININTEMNYWPAEPTGLAECTAPLIALVRDLAETGTKTAREMYGARGWVAHHNTDLWRATAPIDGARDVRRARLGGASQHRSVARDGADRRRAMGHVGDGRCLALHASVGAVRLWPRPGLSAQRLSADARRGAVLPRHAPERSEHRPSGHQSVDVAREFAFRRRQRADHLRRAGDGHGIAARPVRADRAGGEDPRPGRGFCARTARDPREAGA